MKPLAVHVVTSLDFGGVERHMLAIRSASAEARYDHRFCALGSGGAAAEELTRTGHPPDVLNLRPRIPTLATLLALKRYLRSRRPAVLHCHGAEANFHGLLAGFMARVPVRLGEEIGIPNHSSLAITCFALVYRSAHRIVAISNSVRQWLIDSGEAPAEKIVRIYNPVQEPARGLERPPDGVLRVGFVGRLEPVKNATALILAAARLSGQGASIEVWIIGDGSERRQLEQLTRDSGLDGRVRFFGYQRDPASLLRQCHIYVQPSLAEGFGLALVEAMRCELPVIATNVGGAPEIIEEGQSGWIVSPNATDLERALAVASAMSRASLAAMGAYARQSVADRFHPTSYLHELEALYDEERRNVTA